MSFATLIERFRSGICASAASRPPASDPLPLATAAVLLEIAYADGELSPAEDTGLVEHLQRAFSLDDEATRELLRAAGEIRNRTIDHYSLTSFIRAHASFTDRLEIVRTMWRIVYSDGRLTDYENYMVRKLAGLLGLEHHVMIDVKVAVLSELGLGN